MKDFLFQYGDETDAVWLLNPTEPAAVTERACVISAIRQVFYWRAGYVLTGL